MAPPIIIKHTVLQAQNESNNKPKIARKWIIYWQFAENNYKKARNCIVQLDVFLKVTYTYDYCSLQNILSYDSPFSLRGSLKSLYCTSNK